MIKHATSHGLSTLVCTLSASLFVETIKPMWPQVYLPISRISSQIQLKLPVVIAEEFISVLLISTILALLWGIAFKLTTK